MANLITALEIQNRSKDRVSVFVNNEYAFAVDISAAIHLKKGEELSEPRIEQLKAEDKKNQAYISAVRFLGFRPRSRVETKRYLQGKGYPPETITETVDRLVQEKYLNDYDFARFWLRNREQFRPRSAYALRCELRQKGIDDNSIDAALVNFDDHTSAWAAVKPKLQHWHNLSDRDLKKKVIGFLNRRGFDFETCNRIFDRALASIRRS